MIAVLRPIAHVIVIAVLVFVLCPLGSADIPQMISYQGKVTDTGGTPIPDGTYAMRFTIYDDATGGTDLWYSGVVNVQVTDGIFNVLLGESPPAIDLPFDEDYWLSVWIDGDTQSPRQRLCSVGYAHMASGLVPGTEVSGMIGISPYAAIKGTNTLPIGNVYGLYGRSESTDGNGVYGEASAATGTTYGGKFESASTSGRGVYGEASAATGTTYGGRFKSASTSGRGVYGYASATSGTNYGVYGNTASPSGYAGYFQGDTRVTGDLTVDGALTAPGVGDITAVNAGTGLDGGGTSGNVTLDVEVPFHLTGSVIDDGVIKGVNAQFVGIGVHGVVTSTSGSGMTRGVLGESANVIGAAVYGDATATSGSASGVIGRSASPSGLGVYYSGGLAGTGTKSCVVKTSRGPTLLFCQESPECWFEDFGEGRLVDGRCHIELDPFFLETVTIDAANPMKVFVQPDDPECRGLAVVRGTDGFEVVELHDGDSSTRFAYRVVAKRKGFEQKRLDYCAAAEIDGYLYPELREKELREFEDEKAKMQEERHRLEVERTRTAGMNQATGE